MPGVGRTRNVVRPAVFVVFLLAPAVADAQSAFSGIVRDSSGAVLPGVTVEASSPVLIEKTRTAVTDGEGRYSIVDLRPGTYLVVFTLTGFNTFRREGLELPANFTMQINADLRVGSLEESITVTGDAPVVDVQSTQRTQVLNRELLDAIPSARNYSGLAALMPGVRMSNTDVGGNQQMEQIYMTVHGSRQTDTTVQVDGLQLNSLMNDGQVQAYYSDAANAEVTYQTSGIGADVSGGGVRINMIPKEGGNRVSGSVFAGGTNGAWQSDNVTQELIDRGLQSGDRVDHISDYNFAIGGPIRRDRLWYFTTFRRIATNEIVANNFYKDGRPGIEDQWIYNMLLRTTWQMTQKNKLTAYYDRYPKFKGHEMGALTDPETAAARRDWKHAIYYTAQAKYTSTVTSRLLLEAGYSTNIEYLYIGYQPGVQKDRWSPEWYETIGKTETIAAGTATQFAAWDSRTSPANAIDPKKYVISTSASYVTGSHNFKAGFQWGFGSYVLEYDINGDLSQRYRNGLPDVARIYNTPVRSEEFLNGDMGFYAQDSWTLRRLTVNGGVRLERFVGQISDQDVGPGRFVGARHLDEIECMPCWFDVTPRLGAAYDLFGNARTALKVSFNKYMAGQTLSYAQRYNPLGLDSDDRAWRDCDFLPGSSTCSGRSLATNGDNIAQENEIGPSNDLSFGLPVLNLRPDPDLRREYDLEWSTGIQHELMRGLSVSGAWYRRSTHNQRRTDNILVSFSDYTPVDVVSPMNGEVITVYNLNTSKRGQIDQIDVNSTDADKRSRVYNGFELGMSGRLRGASFFGGWTFDRSQSITCDTVDNPNSLRFCNTQEYGDWPLRHEFKLSGSYRLPFDIQTNVAFQSYAGGNLTTTWSIGQTTRYAVGCPGPCRPGQLVIPGLTPTSLSVTLVEPGTDWYERQNQLDVGFRKLFRVNRYQFSGQADIFNFTNNGKVKSQTTTWGSSYGRPLSTLQPRTLRLAMQMRF
jgi:Carboxypeptidase regulatory-like domain/TonB-dependent Receptor Plug Domain